MVCDSVLCSGTAADAVDMVVQVLAEEVDHHCCEVVVELCQTQSVQVSGFVAVHSAAGPVAASSASVRRMQDVSTERVHHFVASEKGMESSLQAKDRSLRQAYQELVASQIAEEDVACNCCHSGSRQLPRMANPPLVIE